MKEKNHTFSKEKKEKKKTHNKNTPLSLDGVLIS